MELGFRSRSTRFVGTSRNDTRPTSLPAWFDGEPNPPLSARAAKDIAAVYLSDLFKNASAWRAGDYFREFRGKEFFISHRLTLRTPRRKNDLRDATAAEFPLAVGGQGGQTLLRAEDRLVQESEITERGRIDDVL